MHFLIGMFELWPAAMRGCGRMAPPLMLMAALFTTAAAAASEPAGYVLTTVGEVVAVQADKGQRPLKRKSPFYSGESLRTGSGGKAQLRFRDGSLIAMRPDTEIRLDEYRFNEPQTGADRNIFTLISGGFRTITGKIGKGDPDAYQMKSSVASIGVRGTTYEAVLRGGLDVAAWQGTIIVANEQGQMAVGVQGLYNFASVQSGSQAPRGLMKPPATIRSESRGGEVGGAGEKGEGASQSESSDEGGGEGGGGSGESGDGDALPPLMGDGGPAMEQGDSAATSVAAVFDPVTSDQSPLLTAAPAPPPLVPAPTPAPSDQRLVGVTLDRLGMAVGGGSSYSQMIAGGRAGYGGGLLYIADNGFGPSEPGFATAPYVSVLTPGGAAATPVSSYSVDASTTVQFGRWDATATNPVRLLTDAADSTLFTAIIQPVYWGTATASSATAFATRSGIINYRNVLAFNAGSSLGAVDAVYMDLMLDFNTGNAAGAMHVHSGTDFWKMGLSGTISAPVINFTSVTGTLNGAVAAQGVVDVLFTGSSAQALALGFDFQAVGNPATYAEGMVLLNDIAQTDVRLTSAELASIDRFGIVMRSNALTGHHVIVGGASNGAGGDPLFGFNGLLPGMAGFSTTPFFELVRRNGVAPLAATQTHGLYPVSWGIWDAGSLWQLSHFDPLDNKAAVDPLVWVTVVPTTSTSLAGTIGGRNYYGVASAFGVSHNGVSNGGMEPYQLALAVNFDTAKFRGRLFLETAYMTESWRVYFEGAVTPQGPVVSNYIAPTYNGPAGSALPFASDLRFTFTGPSPVGVVATYDLELSVNPNYYTQGVALASMDLRLSAQEAAEMHSHVGLLANSGALVAGRSSSGDLGASPVFMSAFGSVYGDPEFLYGNGYAWRQGAATSITGGTHLVAAAPGFDVNWGGWNGTSDYYTDPANAAAIVAASGPLSWITFTPTPVSAIAAKSGVVSYNVPVGMVGINADPGSLGFVANLDFGTGNLTGGVMTLTSAAVPWIANFSGVLTPAGGITTTVTGGFYNSVTPLSTSSMQLALTGPNAEAMAGSFSLMAGGPTTSGVFLICQSGGGC